jgi:nucleoside-diphosphate-sugar epimerase
MVSEGTVPMGKPTTVLVIGAGGFIGHHLVKYPFVAGRTGQTNGSDRAAPARDP